MSPITTISNSCQALIERTSQIVFSFDITSKEFTYLNPAYEQVLRRTRKSASDHSSLLAMVHSEDLRDLEEKYRQVLAGEVLKNAEFRIQLADQSERWLCLMPFLQEEESGNRQVVGFAEDISHYKQYNNYLKRFSDKKNAILNILSHELAGPLAMIEALSSHMLDDLQEGKSKDIGKLLDLIRQSSQEGVQLIQEFVNQEFLESTHTDVIKHRLDIVERLKRVMAKYKQNERGAGLTYRVRCAAFAGGYWQGALSSHHSLYL